MFLVRAAAERASAYFFTAAGMPSQEELNSTVADHEAWWDQWWVDRLAEDAKRHVEK